MFPKERCRNQGRTAEHAASDRRGRLNEIYKAPNKLWPTHSLDCPSGVGKWHSAHPQHEVERHERIGTIVPAGFAAKDRFRLRTIRLVRFLRWHLSCQSAGIRIENVSDGARDR